MITRILARTRLVVPALAIVGLLVGLVMAYGLTMREERYMAQATLAMVPAQDVAPELALQFWEVLNRGQATRTAALALEDHRWLANAASAVGIHESGITLSAAAIPETTLVTVQVEAPTSWGAEEALDVVLKDGASQAAMVSGPFRLETITAVDGSAIPLAANGLQILGALGVAGVLAGAGVGLLISRSAQARSARRTDAADLKRSGGQVAAASVESISLDYSDLPPVKIPAR